MALVEVKDLKIFFPIKSGFFSRWRKEQKYIHAVNGVSFKINKGETLGLVGESGCGKSTTGRTILGLYEPTSGDILFEGQSIVNLLPKERFPYRRKMQMIFQDPYSSLNPRMKVKEIIAEPIITHKLVPEEELEDFIFQLMEKVGIDPDYANRYPHQFSGGQRQRIGIARALAMQPDFIVADEPISALDVSIQAQILNLLMDLQEEFGLTYLFIAHDLSVVKHISDRVAIMYLGKICEIGKTEEIFSNPLHPYTRALFDSIPRLTTTSKSYHDVLEGDVPNPIDLPNGCYFHPRCRYAMEVCRQKSPEMKSIENRQVACHLIK
ncbi:peptide ABC transporter ATP-binding protein [Anoxybacter fermentans]|uniref:Peptide ABC transporter ATP-binding protein n=1 Tax=Anoxybacter fermentans TaxID=1323375 RepID=A0A3Q9HQH0_9FIRM|nr:dipeptide ABC transporter ATP-binding protein [Anoxybacter fermentans]AZR73389.1 peptide ABC transporter ATP-binding protein [Anoxybacter fermentans]